MILGRRLKKNEYKTEGIRTMKEKFITAFETVLATNQNGEVRNLLITDDDTEFLDEALYRLYGAVYRNRICKIQGRELIKYNKKSGISPIFCIYELARNHFWRSYQTMFS